MSIMFLFSINLDEMNNLPNHLLYACAQSFVAVLSLLLKIYSAHQSLHCHMDSMLQ